MVVRQLTDGQELDCVLLVRERELRTKRDGSEYLRLSLGDRTGTVPAVLWDGVADLSAACDSGVAASPRHSASSVLRKQLVASTAPVWKPASSGNTPWATSSPPGVPHNRFS